MKNKGQGAMEYLMTYGWAILVVIIVGIVLWQSGVFGTGSGGVSGFDKVRVEDYSCTASGTTVKFENAAGQTMKFVSVNASDDNWVTTYTMSFTGNNWAPGKEYSTSNTTLNCSQNEGYTHDYIISYTAPSGISHTETGRIRGKGE